MWLGWPIEDSASVLITEGIVGQNNRRVSWFEVNLTVSMYFPFESVSRIIPSAMLAGDSVSACLTGRVLLSVVGLPVRGGVVFLSSRVADVVF